MKKLNGAIFLLTLIVVFGVFALVGCAPKQVIVPEGPDSSGDTVAMGFKWSEDTDCIACHSAQKESNKDWHEAVLCIECHSDSVSLEKAHAKVTLEDTDGASRLKSTKVLKEACLACHAVDYTPDAVADFVGCVGAKSTVTNPHDLPQILDHNDILCASCHPDHSGSTADTIAPKLCENCHE